jgi:hypothetical protein
LKNHGHSPDRLEGHFRAMAVLQSRASCSKSLNHRMAPIQLSPENLNASGRRMSERAPASLKLAGIGLAVEKKKSGGQSSSQLRLQNARLWVERKDTSHVGSIYCLLPFTRMIGTTEYQMISGAPEQFRHRETAHSSKEIWDQDKSLAYI